MAEIDGLYRIIARDERGIASGAVGDAMPGAAPVASASSNHRTAAIAVMVAAFVGLLGIGAAMLRVSRR